MQAIIADTLKHSFVQIFYINNSMQQVDSTIEAHMATWGVADLLEEEHVLRLPRQTKANIDTDVDIEGRGRHCRLESNCRTAV